MTERKWSREKTLTMDNGSNPIVTHVDHFPNSKVHDINLESNEILDFLNSSSLHSDRATVSKPAVKETSCLGFYYFR